MGPVYNLIIPYLYIGGQKAIYKEDIKFDTIINCTTNVECPDYCKKCIKVSVNNSKKDCQKFFEIITKTDVLKQIHNSIKNKKTVLVHCMEGMHRSCSLVACYFMRYYKMNIKDSMAFVKSKRPIAFSPVYNVFCVIEMYYNYLHTTPKQIDNIEIKEKQPDNLQKQPDNLQKQPNNLQKQPDNLQKQPDNLQKQPDNVKKNKLM